MDNSATSAQIEIHYRGSAACDQATSYHRELEELLGMQIPPPEAVPDEDAVLGYGEIIIGIVLGSIGKGLALAVVEHLKKRIKDRAEETDGTEVRIQIIVKKRATDHGKRFPLFVSRLKDNVLTEFFDNIREEISRS